MTGCCAARKALEVFTFVAVERDEDEQHDGEGPHRGTSVADEREWNTDHRHQTDGHTDVDEQVHEDAAGLLSSIATSWENNLSSNIIQAPLYHK